MRPPSKTEIARARRQLTFAKRELEKAAAMPDAKAAWAFWATAYGHTDQARTVLGEALPEDDDSGHIGRDPDPSPSGELARRAMEATQRAFKEEFADDAQWPHVTLVVTLPPHGRVVTATTEPDVDDALLALKQGWGAMHKPLRLLRERADRQ